MMFKNIGLLLCSSIVLSGCVAVSTRMVGTDTAVVSASNNEASVAESRSAALAAAAKMARKLGYEYFGVTHASEGGAGSFTYLAAQVPDLSGASVNPQGRISADAVRSEVRTELTVRFLHPTDLPEKRDGIYSVSDFLVEKP
jgi:hypothetical protein